MIQYPYNLVDMDGIDLITSNGRTVQGLYNKIMQAKDACGSLALYNWKIADIEIPPQYVAIFPMENYLLINGAIKVTIFDVISLVLPEPPEPVVRIVPLTATENRTYSAVEPIIGFNPVEVEVPHPDQPILVPIVITTDPGTYYPQDYEADGFSSVTVQPSQRALHVWTNSTGGNNASVYLQQGIIRDGEFVPATGARTVPYTEVRSQWTSYGIFELYYSNFKWQVRGSLPIIFEDNVYSAYQTAASWQYNVIVDYLFKEQI